MRKVFAAFDAWLERLPTPLSSKAFEEGIDGDDLEAIDRYGQWGVQLMIAGVVLKVLLVICHAP